MDYGMTEEQKMIQDLAKKIAVEKALPLREELDISGEFPWTVVKALAESNLTGIGIEEKYDGIGGGTFEYCIATEELSIICGGIALAFAATGLGTMPIIFSAPKNRNKNIFHLSQEAKNWPHSA